MPSVFLSLGTNIGDRLGNIRKAIKLLENEGVTIEKKSKIVETKPVGGPPQPKFLNTVIRIRTQLKPLKLLKTIKRIEKEMGRTRAARFGPRIIDLDILLYDEVRLKSKQLEIPHPRMWKRQFVLKPLGSLIGLSRLKKIKKLYLD